MCLLRHLILVVFQASQKQWESIGKSHLARLKLSDRSQSAGVVAQGDWASRNLELMKKQWFRYDAPEPMASGASVRVRRESSRRFRTLRVINTIEFLFDGSRSFGAFARWLQKQGGNGG